MTQELPFTHYSLPAALTGHEDSFPSVSQPGRPCTRVKGFVKLLQADTIKTKTPADILHSPNTGVATLDLHQHQATAQNDETAGCFHMPRRLPCRDQRPCTYFAAAMWGTFARAYTVHALTPTTRR